MRKILVIFLFYAACAFSNDTDSCFNLLEYVPPAFNYHSFELKPRFSLNGDTRNSENSSTFEVTDDLNTNRTLFETVNLSQNFGIDANYSFYGWKDRTEWELSASLSGRGYIDHSPEKERIDGYTKNRLYPEFPTTIFYSNPIL